MSIEVELADLQDTTHEYGWAYLLTVRDDLRPHVVAVSPSWADGSLVVQVGGGTARNVAARSSITLCYPPIDPAAFSLVVDGQGSADEAGRVEIRPTSAVLHRPAPPAS